MEGASDKHEHQVDTVAMDYVFLGQEDQDDLTPVLILKHSKSKAIFSHPVTCKGTMCEWVISRVVKDIESVGIRKVILKSDQEPAIIALKTAIISLREHETIPENSPVGESKANGMVENAIRQVFAQIRTLKDALGCRVGKRIPPDSNILLWMIEYASVLLNRFPVGRDGLTAYRRIKGKRCAKPVAEFGESIFYRGKNGD